MTSPFASKNRVLKRGFHTNRFEASYRTSSSGHPSPPRLLFSPSPSLFPSSPSFFLRLPGLRRVVPCSANCSTRQAPASNTRRYVLPGPACRGNSQLQTLRDDNSRHNSGCSSSHRSSLANGLDIIENNANDSRFDRQASGAPKKTTKFVRRELIKLVASQRPGPAYPR